MSPRPIFKRLSSNVALLVMLALQLMLGMQFQAAQAVAAPDATGGMSSHMRMTAAARVADANASGADAATVSQTDVAHADPAHAGAAQTDATHTDAVAQPDCDTHTDSDSHGCCHLSACQCHCVYTPGATALPALANIATSVAIPSAASTQFVAPRIDEFLRPPIA